MKVVILAGGKGTRIAEYSKKIPKPMVKINDVPIIVHIMKHYAKYGFDDFIIALGYKSSVVKKYFNKNQFDWKIKLVDTGLNSMTGGRVRRLKKILGNQTFMLTYGDGISNVNINKLLKFHRRNKNLITLTAVRPPSRFGAIKLKGNIVKYFKEKSNIDEGWINGGFFVIEPDFINLIKNDNSYLEREPLELSSKKKELFAYRHEDFWQCMVTKRDKDLLEKILKKGEIKF